MKTRRRRLPINFRARSSRADKPIQLKVGCTLFSSQAEVEGKIDAAKGIVRDVSVITAGVEAKGHNLLIDDTTLNQMLECAKRSPEGVKVKADHGSGVNAIFGKLINFRIRDSQLRADLVLFKEHANFRQTLELIRNLSTKIGLSTSFAPGPNEMSGTKKLARCADLLSVDLVDSPAANPKGLFSAKVDTENLDMKVKTPGQKGRSGTKQSPADEAAALRARLAEIEGQGEGEDDGESGSDDDDEDEDETESEDEDDITNEDEDETGDDVEDEEEDDEITDEVEGDEEDPEAPYQDSYAKEDAALAGREAKALSRGDKASAVALHQQREINLAVYRAEAAERRVQNLEAEILSSGQERIKLEEREAFEANMVNLRQRIDSLVELNQKKDLTIKALRAELKAVRTEPVALSAEGRMRKTEFGEVVRGVQEKNKGKTGNDLTSVELAAKENPEAHEDYLISIGVMPPRGS